jgi:hypothetical protein
MRKLVLTILTSLLLLSVLAPTALAIPGPVPTADHIPHEIMPGDAEWTTAFGFSAYDDLWVEVDELPYGEVWELPTTTQEDDLFRGPLPLCFNFKFMGGPPKGLPVYRMCSGSLCLVGWDYVLRDEGYDVVWVSDNGYIMFPGEGWGSWNYDEQGFDPTPPNNYIAPYWADFAIGDNTYYTYDASNCETEHLRPRGKVLAACVGTAPNRVMVIEWLNARQYDTGHLATFQVQLFEGSNAILFLYKSFEGKGTEPVFLNTTRVVIGMEDYFGGLHVGELFEPTSVMLSSGPVPQEMPVPVADESMRGFVY